MPRPLYAAGNSGFATDAAAIVPPPRTLSVTPSSGGTVNLLPGGGSYDHGTVVTAAAQPAPGWQFSHWEGDLGTAPGWWDTRWGYRVPLTLTPNGYARHDAVADVGVDFAGLLLAAGVTDAFNPNSIRVVEIDGGGNITNADVLFQYHPLTPNRGFGTLSLLVNGVTPADGARTYHIYFDTNTTIPAPALLTKSVHVTPSVTYSGTAILRIATAVGTYDLELNNGGLSSAFDLAGNDWISFDPTPGSETEGEFRGLPNAVFPEGKFHPGFNVAASQLMPTTDDVFNARFRETVHVATNDGKWEGEWIFYPRYATFKMLKVDAARKFWLLYEGTPGGELEPATDLVGRPDGTRQPASEPWSGDLVGEEWVYFVDPAVSQSFFLVHHEDDDIVDSYVPFGGMTVFGFGRDGLATDAYLTTVPQHVTMGFADGISHETVADAVYSAYKGMGVNLGSVQRPQDLPVDADPTQASLPLSMEFNRTVHAVFVADEYELTVNTAGPGAGVIEVQPVQDFYIYGDKVTLTAKPAVGAKFADWSGAADGTTPTLTLDITGSAAITGHFDLETYPATIVTVGPGAVLRAPDEMLYTYGHDVVLTAVPDDSAQFVGWSGALAGTELTRTVTIDGPLNVTATFASLYTLTVTTEGNGIVIPADGLYLDGADVQLEAVASAGWAFVGWSGDADGAENPRTVVMDRARSVMATFRRAWPVNTTVVGSGAIEIDPSSPPYFDGQTLTLTAAPAENWLFTGWEGDLSGTEISVSVELTRALEVTATFVRGWELTVQTTGEGSVEWAPERGLYEDGTSVTLTAVPDEGWRFTGWSGAASGSEPTVSLEMRSDAVVTARFAPEQATWAVYLPIIDR